MKLSNRSGRWLLAVSILILFFYFILWQAVQLHGTVPLGNGYTYWHTDLGVLIRCFPEKDGKIDYERMNRAANRAEKTGAEELGLPRVGPNLDGYRAYNRIIIGHVSLPKYKQSWGEIPRPKVEKPVGYFIIDLRDDRLYQAMSKTQWLKKLKSFGVNAEPKLFEPAVYDELLGRNKPKQRLDLSNLRIL